jgi:serine/threonine-protein kinase
MADTTIGPYRLRREIGDGGYSKVYEAYDPQGRQVALKLLEPSMFLSRAGQQRFLREVEAARRLRHRHIVPVYHTDFYRDRGYVVMRLMTGGTASKLTAQYNPAEPPVIDRVLRHTARALDFAHSQNVIHRDVKPSNILFDSRQAACLCDFGIAKIRGFVTVTRPKEVIGTIYYMSPEQVRGMNEMTPASDVYSLGVVLYELATGRVPFYAQADAATLHAIVHSPPPSPRMINPAIGGATEKVLLKALNKEPQHRYRTAQELAAAYQDALQRDKVYISPPPKKPPSRPKPPTPQAGVGSGYDGRRQQDGRFWAFIVLILVIIFLMYLGNS